MRIGNKKLISIYFSPYEYKELEKYLEEMALKGWKLESIFGLFFKFERIEPKRIKYFIDVLNDISYWDGKDSVISLEHRKKLCESGWDFVGEREKVQIFCSEHSEVNRDISRITIEKLKGINKASLTDILLKLFTFIILGFSELYMIFIDNDLSFLANNTSLLLMVFTVLFLIINTFDLIRLMRFKKRSKIAIKNCKDIKSNSLNWIRAKSITSNIMILILGTLLISLAIKDQIFSLNIIILMVAVILGIYIVINYITKSTIKNRKKINIAVYFVTIIAVVLFINNFLISSIFRNKRVITEKDNSSQHALSLKDFNDEIRDKDGLYINEDKSFLAHTMFYSANGKNVKLSYDLFESDYEWIVDWNFNKMMDWFEKNNISYNEIRTDLPSKVKVYSNKNNNYILVSSNKIIEIISCEEDMKNDVLKKTYDKIFS